MREREHTCQKCSWDGVSCTETPNIPPGTLVIHHTTPEVRRTMAGKIKNCPIYNLDRRFARQLREIKKEFLGK